MSNATSFSNVPPVPLPSGGLLPVAGAIALAAMAIAGGMLIFGGELNDFARRLVYIVLVAGILLGATTIVGLFGATGASIGITATILPGTVSLPMAVARGEGDNG